MVLMTERKGQGFTRQDTAVIFFVHQSSIAGQIQWLNLRTKQREFELGSVEVPGLLDGGGDEMNS